MLTAIALAAGLVVAGPGAAPGSAAPVTAAHSGVARAPAASAPSPARCVVKITGWAGYDCGYISVPTNHADPAAGSIRLAYIRLRSSASKPDTPVLDMSGSIGDADYYASRLAPLLRDRDYVFLAPRGSRYSQPSLTCPFATPSRSDAWVRGIAPAQIRQTALRTCADAATARGIDLRDYGIGPAADDFEAARVAFGYARVDVAAQGDGVTVAEQALRRHPGTIEAAILDGAGPAPAEVTAQLVGRVDADCRAEPACAAQFPDTPAAIGRLYQKLQKHPVVLAVPVDGRPQPVRVDGAVATAAIIDSMSSRAGTAQMPRLAALVAGGMTGAMVPYLTAYLSHTEFGLADYARLCAEAPAPSRPANSAGSPAVAAVAANAARDLAAGCAAVRLRPAPVPKGGTAVPPIPVPALIVTGGLDPAGGAAESARLAAAMPRSRRIQVPTGARVQSGDPCVIAVVAAFLSRPDRQAGASCLDSEPDRPPFITDRQVVMAVADGRRMSMRLATDLLPITDVQPGAELQLDTALPLGVGPMTYTTIDGSETITGEIAWKRTGPERIAAEWERQTRVTAIPMTNTGSVHGMPYTAGRGSGSGGEVAVSVFARPDGSYVVAGVASSKPVPTSPDPPGQVAVGSVGRTLAVDLPYALQTLTIGD